MKERIERFLARLKKQKLNGVFLTSMENKYYITGFYDNAGDTYALLTRCNVYLFVDARYYERAKKECPDVNVVLFAGDLFERIKEVLDKEELKEVGIEDFNMTVALYNAITSRIGVKLTPVNLTNVRAVKDAMELFYIKKAVSIVDAAFKDIKKFIKVGMKEVEVRDFVDETMKKYGASAPSFETIVVSGKKGSMPHGTPGNKRIENGDFVTIDFGAFYHGYASDMTRTIVMGKPKDKRMKEIYEIVREANEAGIAAVKPGVKACEVDKAARDVIEKAGYGKYFTHSTGHGIGILIHDELGVYPRSEIILEEGMVFTVEPGIYVPGVGGVRIEDDVLVTEDGVEVLTKSHKKLISIK